MVIAKCDDTQVTCLIYNSRFGGIELIYATAFLNYSAFQPFTIQNYFET